MRFLSLDEKIQAKHEEVDEWASEEHDNLEPDDEGEHYYVNREAEEKHELINKENQDGYNLYLEEIYLEEKAKESEIEYYAGIEREWSATRADEAHRVLDGETCFSLDNPFMALFTDW